MAYKKETSLKYDQLSTNTLHRFAELELQRYLKILQTHFELQFEPYQKALDHLLHVVAGRTSTNMRDELKEAFSSYRFRKPTRDETVQYFRYKNLGIAKVSKYAQVSPNTVVTYNEQHPDFTPVFKQWDTPLGQEVIERWDHIKNTLNLFDDKIIHNEPLIRKVYTPEALPPEITESTMKETKKKHDRNDPTIDRSKYIWIVDEWMERYDEHGNKHDYGV